MISLLIYSYYYFHPSSCYHMLPQLGTLHLTSRVYLRLANRPSAQFQNSSIQERLQAQGTTLNVRDRNWLSCKPSTSISLTESPLGILQARNAVNFFFLQFTQREKKKKWRATYEDQFSTVTQWNAAFSVQEIHRLNANFIMRSTYNEPREICPRQT